MPTKRGKHDGLGRDLQKDNDPPLPKALSRAAERAIEAWLEGHRPIAPTGRAVTVSFLVLVCWLHERGYHFPVRRRAGEALGTGRDSVDSAIATSIHYGEITERYETLPSTNGRTQQLRLNRYRYLVPSPQLYQIYVNSQRKVA